MEGGHMVPPNGSIFLFFPEGSERGGVVEEKIFSHSWSWQRFRFVDPSQERVVRGGSRVIVQLHPSHLYLLQIAAFIEIS